MNWIQRYKLRSYVREANWILPACGMVLTLAFVRCIYWIEEQAGWQSTLDPGRYIF